MTGSDGGGRIDIKVHSTVADGATRPRPLAVAAPPSVPLRGLFGPPTLRSSSWLVPTIVVINFVLFIVTMYVNNCPKNSNHCFARFLGPFSFEAFKTNPLLGPAVPALDKMGALDAYEIVEEKQIWRLFSCIWLHGGVFHVLSNMLGLVLIGIRLEQDYGSARIGLIYLISGVGGSLFSALFIESGISVGASGALFGLLGGMLSELLTNWTTYDDKFAALLILVTVILSNLALGILPHMDNFAHIGGFITGFLAGFVILLRPQYGWISQRNSPNGDTTGSIEPKHKMYQYVLCVVSSVLLIAVFVVGISLLLKGVNMNDHCSWCHYLSCVPSSKWKCNTDEPFCQLHQMGNQLNLTCLSNSRSHVYYLSDEDPSYLEKLCSRLCR